MLGCEKTGDIRALGNGYKVVCALCLMAKGVLGLALNAGIYWKVLDGWLTASLIQGHFKGANSCSVSPQMAVLSSGGELNE